VQNEEEESPGGCSNSYSGYYNPGVHSRHSPRYPHKHKPIYRGRVSALLPQQAAGGRRRPLVH